MLLLYVYNVICLVIGSFFPLLRNCKTHVCIHVWHLLAFFIYASRKKSSNFKLSVLYNYSFAFAFLFFCFCHENANDKLVQRSTLEDRYQASHFASSARGEILILCKMLYNVQYVNQGYILRRLTSEWFSRSGKALCCLAPSKLRSSLLASNLAFCLNPLMPKRYFCTSI